MGKPEEVEAKLTLVKTEDGKLYLMGNIPSLVNNSDTPQFALEITKETFPIAYANKMPRWYRKVKL